MYKINTKRKIRSRFRYPKNLITYLGKSYSINSQGDLILSYSSYMLGIVSLNTVTKEYSKILIENYVVLHDFLIVGDKEFYIYNKDDDNFILKVENGEITSKALRIQNYSKLFLVEKENEICIIYQSSLDNKIHELSSQDDFDIDIEISNPFDKEVLDLVGIDDTTGNIVLVLVLEDKSELNKNFLNNSRVIKIDLSHSELRRGI